MIGFFLIILGVIFLLKNFGVISGSVWGILWPALLIVAGLGMILRRGRHGFFWEERFGWRKQEKKDEESNKILHV
ncbi:MAG: DUF5668 domain-containing protein [Patescibacteria group bacterium]